MKALALDALLLVGGLGTRLRETVPGRPKPLAEVAGRPFVEWLLLDLRRQDVRRVTFCTGHLGEQFADRFGDGADWEMEFAYSHETSPLGTAGAIRLALGVVEASRFLVLNGDSYCPWDLRRLQDAHAARRARTTLWLARAARRDRFGSVVLEEDGRVRSFQEKAPEGAPGLVNAGIYLLERELIEQGVEPGRASSLERDVLPGLVGTGLYGVVGDEPLVDMGTAEGKEDAERVLRHLQHR